MIFYSVTDEWRFWILAFWLLNAVTLSAQTTTYKFDFGEGVAAKGFIKVTPNTRYSHKQGYGFEFQPQLTAYRNSNKGIPDDDYITSAQPFYFSVKLPEGNYNVKVILGDAKGVCVTTIKAECRRLMLEKIETKAGAFASVLFTVHIKDSVIRSATQRNVILKPRERQYLHWDDKLTLEFNNTLPKICAVEISPAVKATTIFLAGNSTVVDQANEPWAAWGQMFPVFLKPGIVSVANYAESGETLKAFKGERRLEKIWSMAKPGDYLFIEFAHNDQKPGSNYLNPFTTYKQTLKEWIAEARKRKVTPVLVTSMNRRRFDSSGNIINTLLDYPEAVRQTGKEENVVVLDLNAMSKTLYEAWGPEKSIKAFVHFPANTFPGQTTALKDDTHFSTFGGYELAKCIVEAIRQTSLPLKKYIVDSFKGFDPAHPDQFEHFHLPASTFITDMKPDGN